MENNLIKFANRNGKIECKQEYDSVDEVYINSPITSEIVYCISIGYEAKENEAEEGHTEFYVNAVSIDTAP